MVRSGGACEGPCFHEPNANTAEVSGAVDFPLDDGSYNNTHKLPLTGAASTATGTWGNDVLVGNQWNNALNGNGGNDTFTGGPGNDTITAGAGRSSKGGHTHTHPRPQLSGPGAPRWGLFPRPPGNGRFPPFRTGKDTP